MNVDIDIDLLIEARDGLKAYGKAATEDTVQKLNDVIREATDRIVEFSVGDNVNVKRKQYDQFNHDFTGHVKEVKGRFIVEDQDGDCWEVDADQVSFSSDDIMHA